jgi:predicted RNA-binding protein YlqC (UPF0109 family)
MNKCISGYGQMYQWTWTNVCILIHLFMLYLVSIHQVYIVYVSKEIWYICSCILTHLSSVDMDKCISRHGQMYQWTWTNVSVDMDKCISRHGQMYQWSMSTDTFVHVYQYICPCLLIHLSMSTDTFVHIYWYIGQMYQ